MASGSPRKFVLIGCGRRKLSVPAQAKELYTSPRFRFSFAYAESLQPDEIFILSAKYGLVPAEQRLPPYDETLNAKSVEEIKTWARLVMSQLCRRANTERDIFIMLAGRQYCDPIVPELKHVQLPLAKLRLGEQLRFLKQSLAK